MSQERRSSTAATSQQSRKRKLHHKTFKTWLLSLALGGLLVAPAWCKQPLSPEAANLASQAAANATAGERAAPAKVIPVPTEDVSP
jgi:hypothetical protein